MQCRLTWRSLYSWRMPFGKLGSSHSLLTAAFNIQVTCRFYVQMTLLPPPSVAHNCRRLAHNRIFVSLSSCGSLKAAGEGLDMRCDNTMHVERCSRQSHAF